MRDHADYLLCGLQNLLGVETKARCQQDSRNDNICNDVYDSSYIGIIPCPFQHARN